MELIHKAAVEVRILISYLYFTVEKINEVAVTSNRLINHFVCLVISGLGLNVAYRFPVAPCCINTISRISILSQIQYPSYGYIVIETVVANSGKSLEAPALP